MRLCGIVSWFSLVALLLIALLFVPSVSQCYPTADGSPAFAVEATIDGSAILAEPRDIEINAMQFIPAANPVQYADNQAACVGSGYSVPIQSSRNRLTFENVRCIICWRESMGLHTSSNLVNYDMYRPVGTENSSLTLSRVRYNTRV